MALLVAVERSAGGGHVLSPRAGLGHERLTEIIIRDAQQARRDALLPGRFDEVPARLRLLDDVAGLVGVGEPEHLVVEYEALAPPGEVLLEELHGHVALVDDVEHIEDVVEAELHSRGYERVMRDLAVVEAGAGVDELARPAGALLRRMGQMLAEMAGVGVCQLVKRDRIPVLLRQVNERLCEGELVGRRVTPEQDDASPIGLLGRSRQEVLVYRAHSVCPFLHCALIIAQYVQLHGITA